MGAVHRLDVVAARPRLAGASEVFFVAVRNAVSVARSLASRCGCWSSSSVGACRWRCWKEEVVGDRIGGHLDQPVIEHVSGG